MHLVRSAFPVVAGLSAAILVVAVLANSVSAQDQPENWREYLPPGPAKTIVETRCAVCHDLSPVVRQRQSPAKWQTIVMTMIDLGAPLVEEEEEQVVAYLSASFGTETPPLTDVNQASKDELTKLPGITPALADTLLSHRKTNGPFTSREQVQAVIGLDEESFAKLKWYLRVVKDSR